MARPKTPANESLSEPVRLRTTPATRNNLASKANAAGMNESEFMRCLIDEVPIVSLGNYDPVLVTAFNNYVLQLSGACNNINQLTAATHQDREFVKYWREIGDEIKAELKAGRAVLDELLKGVRS